MKKARNDIIADNIFLIMKIRVVFLISYLLAQQIMKYRKKITADDLTKLFKPENIKEGISISTLASWGGVQGLKDLLMINYKKKSINSHINDQTKADENRNSKLNPKNSQNLFGKIEDDMFKIICVSAFISLALGITTEGFKDGCLQGASILLTVIIIIVITSLNNNLKQKQFQELSKVTHTKRVNVVKNQKLVDLPVQDLYIGDIISLQLGLVLPVDGVLIQGNNLRMDQSSITGQTKSIKKKLPQIYSKEEEADPFIISSSKVIEGNGLAVVATIGKNSYEEKLKTAEPPNDTKPLQQKLTDLADQVGFFGIYFAAATFITMFLHYIYDCSNEQDFYKSLFSLRTLHQIITYSIVAFSIIVIIVPKGLSLAITFSLAYSVKRMKNSNILVRQLSSCETMGGVNEICSDKTGTFTKNVMTVTHIFIEEAVFDTISESIANESSLKFFCLSICNNTDANPNIAFKGNDIINEQIGNKTDCALLEMSFKMGHNYKKIRNKNQQLKVFPFNSEKKKMTTIYEGDKGIKYLFIKGAPDFLLPHCTKYINKNGSVSTISVTFKNSLQDALFDFSSKSLRSILLAYKEVRTVPKKQEDFESELIILGLVGIKDPLRDGIRSAVKTCQGAGIQIRMVTGDSKDTAIAIAKQTGILEENWQIKQGDYSVMEGKEFRELVGGLVKEEDLEEEQNVGNIQNFKLIADQLKVLARSSPLDKYLMATGLKKLNNVVAMSGDGINDVSALKKADIGVTFGIATEAAKEASEIILLDDNFSAITDTVKWGRNILDCIRKFLQFQLTANFVVLMMVFIGGVIFGESPFSPIQMLWVHLMIDTFGSLSFVLETPSDKLLKKMPSARNEKLITVNMWKNIIGQGIIQVFILGGILFKGPQIFGIPSSARVGQWNEETGKHYSIFFNVFVLLQIFNEVNSRKLERTQVNVFENFLNHHKPMIIIMIKIVVQVGMTNYGGIALKTVKLSLNENILCLVLGSSSLLSGLFIKVALPTSLNISESNKRICEKGGKQIRC